MHKSDLKRRTDVDTSNLATKSGLASLKAVVGIIDIDKVKNVLADLNKLDNVVNNVVVEKTVHDKMVIRIPLSYQVLVN